MKQVSNLSCSFSNWTHLRHRSCFPFAQIRIMRLFKRRGRDGSTTAIDRIFLSNTIVNCIFYPILLIYLTFNLFLFPMSDYIGTVGCVALPQFIDVFIRIYSSCFPLTITLLRYTIVANCHWTKLRGMDNLVNAVILISILGPVFMTLTLQYPVGDFIHGPFHLCTGRFEVYYDPTHPDPITPGTYIIERYTVKYNFDFR